MTPDRPGEDPGAEDRPLSPEEEDALTALLRSSAGPIDTPEDVVRRLDRVLSELTAERTAGELTGARPLAVAGDDRRRRRWSRSLLAAAAVAVAGYGVWSAVPDSGSGGAASNASAGASEPAASRSAALPGDAAMGGSARARTRPAPRIRAAHLRADLERALPRLPGGPTVSRPLPLPAWCPALSGRHRYVAVRYAGHPAVVILGSSTPSLGSSAAEEAHVPAVIYDCDGGVLARAAVRMPAE